MFSWFISLIPISNYKSKLKEVKIKHPLFEGSIVCVTPLILIDSSRIVNTTSFWSHNKFAYKFRSCLPLWSSSSSSWSSSLLHVDSSSSLLSLFLFFRFHVENIHFRLAPSSYWKGNKINWSDPLCYFDSFVSWMIGSIVRQVSFAILCCLKSNRIQDTY